MNKGYINEQLEPTHVLTVYSNRYASSHYLESRVVKKSKDGYVIAAPAPMADDVFKEIAASYMKKNSYDMDFGGFVAEHIIYAHNTLGKTLVVWYRPAMERQLNFSKQLNVPTTMVQVPATLAAVHNDELYYFALMSNDRPNAKTKLYNAPFFNIYKKGNVCLGSAQVGKVKAKTFEKEAERFERGFFLAEQNHGHIACCKSPLKEVWLNVIITKSAFPSEQELVPHSEYKTVGDLINSFMGKTLILDDED